MQEASQQSIRPVVTRFPASREYLEESNLPLSVVVTPFFPFQKDDTDQHLTSIPKCGQCGAPHPSAVTHFRLNSGVYASNPSLLCYLCGRVSSLHKPFPDPPAATHDTSTFSLPLRLTEKPLYAVPATSCPPLWFLVLNGSCTDASYWQGVSQALQSLSVPSYVHGCVLLAHANQTWSVVGPQQISHWSTAELAEQALMDFVTAPLVISPALADY